MTKLYRIFYQTKSDENSTGHKIFEFSNLAKLGKPSIDIFIPIDNQLKFKQDNLWLIASDYND